MQLDDVTVLVSRKLVKNVRISISTKGVVKLTAPFFISKNIINDFLHSRKNWIKKHLAKQQQNALIQELSYQENSIHFFLGDEYQLNLIKVENLKRGQEKVFIRNRQLCILSKNEFSNTYISKQLDSFYRQQMQIILPHLISKWQKIIKKDISECRIKKMKTRWGSCNINEKRIWLNLELAKKSPQCLEYVFVHEMVHLLERYHNNNFYQYMDKFLPQWKEVEYDLVNSGQ